MYNAHGLMTFLRLYLCLLPLLAAPALASEPALNLELIGDKSVVLTEHFTVLEDPDATLSLADVQKPDIAARFTAAPSSATALNYGLTRSAYWLRLLLRNDADHDVERLLEISAPILSSVQLHRPAANGGYETLATGNALPFATRPYKNRAFVFPLSLPAKTGQAIYLRVQSSSPTIVPAALWTPSAFHEHERNDYLVQAWYFGMATAMALFNLLLFFALRDAIYLFYFNFATCMALTLASEYGLAKEFLWPNSTFWSNSSTGICLALSLAAGLAFMRRMLDTRIVIPKFDRLLKALVIVFLIVPLGFWLGASRLEIVRFSMLLVAAATLLTLSVGLYCAFFKRQRSAVYYSVAFAVLILGGAMSSLRGLGVLPVTALTTYGVQLGSALEMLLLALALADRFNTIRREKAQAQQLLVENLRTSERVLEERVEQRTAELQATLQDLRATQSQLIQSEKMASLGQLVANIAHEINTPIGAVKSSGKNITDALARTLGNLPDLFSVLDKDSRALFIRLISHNTESAEQVSTREERHLTREATRQLDAAGISEAQNKALALVQLRAHASIADYLPLLNHPQSDLILKTASGVAAIINNSANINVAVERVSRIIFALKSFAHEGGSGAPVEVRLEDGIETVLTLYQSSIRLGVEVIRRYENVPALLCHPDELIQVWTNLIHNALQAMNHQGTLTLAVRRAGNEVVVSVGDTGCGIPDAIRDRIFEAFFSTKPIGEGSGLGLDIVKKIIDKHKGRIEVQSEVGVGSTFSVYLPYQIPA